MDDGYIKLHRKLLGSPIWDTPTATVKAWIACLLLVNWEDRKWYSRKLGQAITIERGSFRTTIKNFAEIARISIKQTRSAWKTLVDLETIKIVAQEGARLGTQITVLNYEQYQENWAQTRAQYGASKGQVKGTDIRSKEVKEINPSLSPLTENGSNGLPAGIRKQTDAELDAYFRKHGTLR